jgi:hypothetical protein
MHAPDDQLGAGSAVGTRRRAVLRRGNLSVTEACFAVGCSWLGTFSTRFTPIQELRNG